MNKLRPGMAPARSRKALANPKGSASPGPAGIALRAAPPPKRLVPVEDRLLALGSLHPTRPLAHTSVGADTSGAACATPEPMNRAATGAPRTIPAPPIIAAVAAKGRTGLCARSELVPRLLHCLLRLDIRNSPSNNWLSRGDDGRCAFRRHVTGCPLSPPSCSKRVGRNADPSRCSGV